MVAQLKDDPENPELQALQNELKDMISLIDESLAELKPQQAPKPAPKAPSPPRAPEKKPAEPSPAEPPEEEPPVPYQVNDEVLAKWLSGDKKFWPARITSITGSSSAPIYLVKFKNYKGTETLRSREIRPISSKRKAEAPPAPPPSDSLAPAPPPPPPPAAAGGSSDGTVLSAAASRYPEPTVEEAAAKPPRPKKIKAKKELEIGKNKWQEFNAKTRSKGSKAFKKDSMFRTPEGIHGRGRTPYPQFR